MKKAFLLGGKFSDIPFIKAAKRMGYYVITSGNNPNDLGHRFSNEVVLEDYSNKEAMLDIAKKLKPDLLIPSCDDYSFLTCSYINDYLQISNFDDFEISKTIHHKNLWRDFAMKNNINSPKAMSFSNINDALKNLDKFESKVIVKPIDSAAGKGVGIIENKNNAKEIINNAFEVSRSKKIVVEEFLEGKRHGFSTIIINKKVVFYFYDNEQYNYNPFAVSGTTTSSELDSNSIENLILEIEKIAEILNLKDGIFHTQTIARMKNNKMELVIIESCRRCGGDLYAQFVEMALNVDYPSLVINALIKNKKSFEINPINPPLYRKFFARQCVMSKKCGTLNKITFKKEIQNNIIDKCMWAKNGDEIKDTARYKAGIIFLEFESKDEMDAKVNSLHKLIDFKLES